MNFACITGVFAVFDFRVSFVFFLEANVYHATKSDGQELAIKVYKTSVLVFK